MIQDIYSGKKLILLIILSLVLGIFAEHSTVTEYVQLGLNNNNIVQRSIHMEDVSKASHKESIGNYLPSISFQSRYSRSEGGRSIALPLGDLLNPVYTSLGFPKDQMLENQDISFMPKEEIEAKIKVIQPLFNPEIHIGTLLNREKKTLQKHITISTKTEIAKNIRRAYYSWILTVEAGAVYELSLKQAQKQLKVTEQLSDAGMVTTDAVYAMQAEVYSAQQAITVNENTKSSVKRQVNQLLNRSLDSSLTFIQIDSLMKSLVYFNNQPQTLKSSKTKILESGYKISNLANSNERLKALPTLAFSLETGLLSDNFEFKNSSFIIGSIIFNWDLFTGLKRRNRITQTKYQSSSLKSDLDEQIIENDRIIKDAFDSFQTSIKALIPAKKIIETSEHYYNRVLKSYETGSKTVSELSEAHLKLKHAKLNFKNMQIEVLLSHSSLLASLDISIE